MKATLRIVSSISSWAVLVMSLMLAVVHVAAATDDPLPSWNDGAPKKAIVAFVERVTKDGDPDFVPVAERMQRSGRLTPIWCKSLSKQRRWPRASPFSIKGNNPNRRVRSGLMSLWLDSGQKLDKPPRRCKKRIKRSRS